MKAHLYFSIVLLAFLIGCNSNNGQRLTPSLITEINERAGLLSAAMVNGDYSRIVDLTEPKIVEVVGGKQVLIEHLRKMFQPSDEKFVKIHTLNFADPTDAKIVGDKLIAVVPYEGIVESNTKKVWVQSCYIAMRNRNGGSWYFIDGSGAYKGKMHVLFPEYDSQLKIPEHKIEEIGTRY